METWLKETVPQDNKLFVLRRESARLPFPPSTSKILQFAYLLPLYAFIRDSTLVWQKYGFENLLCPSVQWRPSSSSSFQSYLCTVKIFAFEKNMTIRGTLSSDFEIFFSTWYIWYKHSLPKDSTVSDIRNFLLSFVDVGNHRQFSSLSFSEESHQRRVFTFALTRRKKLHDLLPGQRDSRNRL